MKNTVTLNRNCDFRRLYGRGKVYTDPALVIYLLKNRAGICRIGITVSKKTGNAVQRNRSKRIIRAAYSAVEESICGNWDFVFVARGKTKYLKSTDIQKVLTVQLLKAGAIKK